MPNFNIASVRPALDATVRPIPSALQSVSLLHEYTDEDGFQRASEYEVPANEWANESVKALLTNITAQANSRQRRAWQYNNELISRVDHLHRCNVPVEALQVIRQLHADLHGPDVKSFMDSYTAFTMGQRFNLAGYDGQGRETGRDMLYKAHHPTGLFKARKTRERLHELERSQVMTRSNTQYVYQLPYFEQRLNALARVMNEPGPAVQVQHEVVDFEIQKLTLLLAGGTPEHVLRANQGQMARQLAQLLQPNEASARSGTGQSSAAVKLGVLKGAFEEAKTLV